MSQQGLILVHTQKLNQKAQSQVSSNISHVAFASILRGENPSEEVDDLSQEMMVFGGHQKLTYTMKQRPEK